MFKTLIYLYLFFGGLISSPLAAASIKVLDSQGREITVSKPPQRIVSTSLGSDEILIEILRRAQRLQSLIAVSELADAARYSNVTKEAPSIKNRVGRNMEKTLSQNPDLKVLASYNLPEIVMRLSAAGDTNSKSSSRNVFVLKDFNTLKDIATNIRTLGQLTFATQEAETLAKEYENTLEKIRARGKKMGPKIKIVGFYPDGAVSGRGTLFDDIVTAAGGENLISTLGLSGWPKLSDEVAATLNPDLLVCGGQSSEKEKIVAAIQQKPGWRAIPAVKAGRLLVLPGNQLGATSQHVLKAVTALQKELLHVQAAAAKDKI